MLCIALSTAALRRLDHSCQMTMKKSTAQPWLWVCAQESELACSCSVKVSALQGQEVQPLCPTCTSSLPKGALGGKISEPPDTLEAMKGLLLNSLHEMQWHIGKSKKLTPVLLSVVKKLLIFLTEFNHSREFIPGCRLPACPVPTMKGSFRSSNKEKILNTCMRGEFLSLTFPAGGVSLDVSLLGLSSQLSVAMDIAVGCWLSSRGGRSASLRSHCPLEGDLAALSALQLQGKKQTPLNITDAVLLLFLTQMRLSSKPRFKQRSATVQGKCRQGS